MTDGGGSSSYGAAYNTGDIIGVKLDMDNNTVDFAKNNSYQGSLSISTTKGDPSTNFFVFAMGGGKGGTNQTFEANFGASGFTYTPPTGFLALNSKNLAKSTIQKGKKYMDIATWTGNSSQRNITGFEFSPDWVWLKKRSGGSSRSHQVFAIIRGARNLLHTDSNGSQNNQLSMNAFNSDGFALEGGSGDDGSNGSGNNYVGWAWDAGSSTVTNSTGNISSQVRANTTAGVSIVSYTGTGADATIGHGLGVTPSAIILKDRDRSVYVRSGKRMIKIRNSSGHLTAAGKAKRVADRFKRAKRWD